MSTQSSQASSRHTSPKPTASPRKPSLKKQPISKSRSRAFKIGFSIFILIVAAVIFIDNPEKLIQTLKYSWLISKYDKNINPLHIASEEGYIEVVKYLIEQCHANVEAKDNYGRTPLHDASIGGKLGVIKYLVERCHANAEAKDKYERTPLSYASMDDKIVNYLTKASSSGLNFYQRMFGWILKP